MPFSIHEMMTFSKLKLILELSIWYNTIAQKHLWKICKTLNKWIFSFILLSNQEFVFKVFIDENFLSTYMNVTWVLFDFIFYQWNVFTEDHLIRIKIQQFRFELWYLWSLYFWYVMNRLLFLSCNRMNMAFQK